MSLRRVLVVLVSIATVSGIGPVAATAAAAVQGGPSLLTPQAELDRALRCPSTFVHEDHEPVLLVHGTATTSGESWAWAVAPALAALGYDVCTVDLPDYALGDVQRSAEYVVNAVRRTSAASGRKVDVAGHSQGNLEVRWAIRWWPDVRAAVDDAVLLGNPSHGILASYPTCALTCFPAGWQMVPRSRFLTSLNAGDETPGDVDVTSVLSYTDELVVPSSTAILTGARNVAVQAVCPGRVVTHVGLLADAVVFAVLVDAFQHSGPASIDRLPADVCGRAYAPGLTALDVSTQTAKIAAGFAARLATAPRTWSEPALRAYAGG